MGKIFQVLVRRPCGGNVAVDLCNSEEQFRSMTVEQLRGKLAQKCPEIAGEDVQLIFTDKRLDEDKKLLSEYGIQHLSRIQVLVIVRGGGDLPPSEDSGMGDKTGNNQTGASWTFPEWLKQAHDGSAADCKTSVKRKDLSNLCVLCVVCTADQKKTYEFCRQCLKPRKGPGPRSDSDGCENKDLQSCNTISLPEVSPAT